MAALKAAVIVMGVLIIAGVAVIIAVLAQRALAPSAASVQAVLDEPAGTRIASVSTAGDRLAMALQGGGPDRVVVVDLRSGRVTARAGLAR